MEKSKVETFVGFSIRARKCKIGCNAIGTIKKANIIILCSSAKENSIKEGISYAKKFNCPLYKMKEKKLEDWTNKENAKIIAIIDKELSNAIIKYNKEELEKVEF